MRSLFDDYVTTVLALLCILECALKIVESRFDIEMSFIVNYYIKTRRCASAYRYTRRYILRIIYISIYTASQSFEYYVQVSWVEPVLSNMG